MPQHRYAVHGAGLAAALALAAAGSAEAQTSPYFLRASETLSYDSNLFRVPEQLGRRREGISSTEATLGIDQPYGRQRYLASAGISANVFKNNDQLNNTGYRLQLGMDWSALSRWSGDIRLAATQQLASFEDYGAQFQTDTSKNLERVQSAALRAQYGLAALWVLEGSYGHRRVDFSNDRFVDREYRQDQVGLGARYQPSDLLTLGIAARYTDGRYPQGSIVQTAQGTATQEDKYTRNDVDLTANWKASGLSTLDARLTATRENHTPIDTRDFHGVTGSVGWEYRPTGKTRFDLRLSRDTGTRGNGVPAEIDTTRLASFLTDARLSTRVDGAVRWDATAKITVQARASYSRDRYDDVFTTTTDQGSVTRSGGDSGNTRNFRIGATYAPTRVWLLGCEVGRRSRSTPVFIGNVGYNYDADVASCSAQLMLQ